MVRSQAEAPLEPSNRKTKRKLAIAALAVASFFIAGRAMAGDEPPKPLRLCADPNNLPFSSKDGQVPGVYVEIGRSIAKALGRDMEPTWILTFFGKRSVRTTLLAGQCDFFVGLPNSDDFMGKKVVFSKTIFHIGYALVTPKKIDEAQSINLKGKTIGVQFQTGPQNLLAVRNDLQTTTVLNPEEAMEDLAAGKIDGAMIWAPIASYMNVTKFGNAYRILPIGGRGMQWAAAIGFAAKDAALRDAVDKALAAVPIDKLLAKYDFPTQPPVILDIDAGTSSPDTTNYREEQEGAGEPPPAVQPPPAGHTEAVPKAVPAAATAAPAAPPAPTPAVAAAPAPAAPAAPDEKKAATPLTGPAAVTAGKETFNGTCAHCHGPNAIQSDRHIDLRRLKHKYGDGMDELFMKTVHTGKPDKGMPNWTGVFTEEQFAQILAYLHSVQTAD